MIAKTGCQKDLGVVIPSDLKWDVHLENAARKPFKVLFMIKTKFLSFPFATKIKLNKSIHLPTLIYGSNYSDLQLSATNVTNLK